MRRKVIPAHSGLRGREQDRLHEKNLELLGHQAKCCGGRCKRAQDAREVLAGLYQIGNAGYPAR